MERQITIRHNQEELTATIHYPLKEAAQGGRCNRIPLVIICHGFVGSRIGVDRLFVKTARAFAEDGYMVIRFDYIGCGRARAIMARGSRFDDCPDAFRPRLWTQSHRCRSDAHHTHRA